MEYDNHLKGIRKGYRTIKLPFLLIIKGFGLKDVSVAYFETFKFEAETDHEMTQQWFFVDAVAVAKGVPVEQDVSGHIAAFQTGKNMRSPAVISFGQPRVALI